jgi:hypothetical protein
MCANAKRFLLNSCMDKNNSYYSYSKQQFLKVSANMHTNYSRTLLYTNSNSAINLIVHLLNTRLIKYLCKVHFFLMLIFIISYI